MEYVMLCDLFPFNKKEHYRFDDDGIKYAISCACHDMTPRTMKKKSDNGLKEFITTLNQDSETSFFNMIKKYFDEPVKDESKYDEWHATACEKIRSILLDYYMDESVTYGKAQKVVNITMKWIVVLEGAEKKYTQHYFDHCHMALDSFILEWIYRRSQDLEKSKRLKRNEMESWSNLTPNTEDSKKGYKELQQLAREICRKDCEDMTPFEAEFYVWKQMQLTLAAEALYNEDGDNPPLKEFKKRKFSDKVDLLKSSLDRISFDRYLI